MSPEEERDIFGDLPDLDFVVELYPELARQPLPAEKPNKAAETSDTGPRPHWLPPDWTIVVTRRKTGRTQGHKDKFYVCPAPCEKKCRSKPEVQNHLALGCPARPQPAPALPPPAPAPPPPVPAPPAPAEPVQDDVYR